MTTTTDPTPWILPTRGPEVEYHAIGACADLFECGEPEILLEGPAGTGKTRGLLEYLHLQMESNPGARVLGVRKTRASMTESVLVTYERDVIPDNDPIVSGPQRSQRQAYHYPNGSEFVIGGMDNPDRIMSTEYDIVAAFEATELTVDDWEKATSRLRNHKIPHPSGRGHLEQAIADCNPDAPTHWLNQRANDNRMVRLLSRHEDNPTVTLKYLERLSNLTGVRRARLYEGKWVAAEGQVWPTYDPAVNLIDRADVPDYKWMFASVDWGFRNPGVVQLWGVDHDDRIYRDVEIYHTKKRIDWWAERMAELYDEFGGFKMVRSIVCDPEDPGNIDKFNDRLGPMRGRDVPGIAVQADNDLQPGLDQVRDGFTVDDNAKPRIYLVRDALRFRDDELVADSKPWCTEHEIPGYVFVKGADGKSVKERPDPGAPDHGCDALRYAAMYAWGRDLTPIPEPQKYAPGSYGDVLNVSEVLGEEWADAQLRAAEPTTRD